MSNGTETGAKKPPESLTVFHCDGCGKVSLTMRYKHYVIPGLPCRGTESRVTYVAIAEKAES